MTSPCAASSGNASSPPARRRAPAVPIAVAVAAGVAFDHCCGGDVRIWLALSLFLLAGWVLASSRRFRFAGVLLLAACAAAGAGWHHLQWSAVRGDHLAGFASDIPRPVRLTGRLVDQPFLIPKKTPQFRDALPEYDRTLATIECTQLIQGEKSIEVSGLARLEVSGHLLHARAGDEVELVGSFARPSVARNPGGFDFRRYLRAAGIHVVIRCGEPDAVRVVQAGDVWWRRAQARLRSACENLLCENLSDRTAAVGVAMLLGTRTGMSDELRTAFAESGTMHILAISGANVAILAGLLWLCCRVLGCGGTATACVVLTGILGYAFVADAQPPVMRAVLMIVVFVAGLPWYRGGSLFNGVALAALGVMAWNPMYLFDVGAQLSFLAVIALIWAPASYARAAKPQALGEPMEFTAGSVVRRAGGFVWDWTLTGYIAVGAMWLFALPLAMARFQMFSPIGFLINVLLAPLMIVILWCGYALLLCGLLVPSSAAFFGVGFDWGLRGLLWLVEASARLPYGHIPLPGPSDAWLVGFYSCLALVVCGGMRSRWRPWGWRLMLVWCVAGLTGACLPSHPAGLRCTFLAVGHGLSVLIELPNGKTLLYDAGQLGDGPRARQTVQTALWQQGPSAIDALVISHADVDHFNGVPGLSESVRIGGAFVHPSFLDFKQSSVRTVCDSLGARQVPIKLIWQDDALQIDSSVAVRVLHPPAGQRSSQDNANSLVLSIEYAGRTVLLTGDLEKDGLQSLLRQPGRDVDILLSPHHGSLGANTRELAKWSRPEWVVASGGRPGLVGKLQAIYGPSAQVLSTQERGAVTFEIGPDGTIRWNCFVPAP